MRGFLSGGHGRICSLMPVYIRGRDAGRTVRTGAGAAVGVVTELVNVEAALGVGIVALEVVGDGGGA